MSRGGRLAVIAIVVAAVGMTLTGCVNLPTTGNAGNFKPNSQSDLPGNQVGFAPRPPGQNWTTEQIVNGFLAASGDEAGDIAGFDVALDYLTPTYAKLWHPNSSSPDVIDTGSTVMASAPTGRDANTSGQQQVTLTSHHLEIMAGRRLQAYRPKTGQFTFTFTLDTVDGQWRINNIIGPNGKTSLLLENSDFQRDYQPRNLYFPVTTGADVLVPYPVYIPDSAPLLGVGQLLNSLLTTPQQSSNWLYASVRTAFPPRTTVKSVQVQGPQADIDLGGAAAHVPYQRLQKMRAQIFWTLTNSPYSGTAIRTVSLTVGKHNILMRGSAFSNWVPRSPAATESLFYQVLNQAGQPALGGFPPGSTFQTGNSRGTRGTHGKRTASTVKLPSGLGRGPLTTFAISPTVPGQKNPPTFAACRGKTVYVTQLPPATETVLRQQLPDPCTSMTWDAQGHLYVSAGNYVYRGVEFPTGLQLPRILNLAPQITQNDMYTSLAFAPDGVRLAYVVRNRGGGGVFVTSLSGPGSLLYMAWGTQLLPVGPDVYNPIDVAWLDADHLLVLDRGRNGPELREVPLDGGPSVIVKVPPDTVSVTSNGSVVAIATAGIGASAEPHIRVASASRLDGLWQPVAIGSTPVYPG